MRRRAPARYAEVVAGLRGVPGRYSVGGERFTVAVAGDRVSVRAGWRGPARAVVEATTGAVLALVDGTESFGQVLADESVVVRADADALLGLAAAAGAFAAEAAGSTTYATQFEEYRSWAAAR